MLAAFDKLKAAWPGVSFGWSAPVLAKWADLTNGQARSALKRLQVAGKVANVARRTMGEQRPVWVRR